MTTASSRVSSSLLAALLASACVEHDAGVTGTTSLRVDITAPTNLGTNDAPLCSDPTQTMCAERSVTVKVTALDQDGQPDTTVNADLDVYAHFLGTLTPDQARHMPLATLVMKDGVATGTVQLASAFGPTMVWAEDTARDGASFATGVSPELRFRDPFLADVQSSLGITRLAWLERSPLEGKQVKITRSQFGSDGALVVTGVYAQGYTVSDVRLSDRFTPEFGHAFIFTFGRPRAEDGRPILVGHTVKWVAGGVSEFNGYTEFNFPQTELTAERPKLERVPAAQLLQASWLELPAGDDGMINLEKVESGLVRVDGGKVCDVANDDSYSKYGQWKLDVGSGCANAYSVATKGQVAGFDPALHTGETLKSVIGTLKAVNIGSFHVWILQPRTDGDIQIN